MSEGTNAVRLTQVDYDPFAQPELARAVPTTDAQRELWLADRLGREASLAFNESITLRMDGVLHLQALQDALLSLSDRHESLRSTFGADGMTMLIAPRGSLQARLLDLADNDAAAQALAALKHDEVTAPFDLTQGPLARATLVRLGASSHELLITAHHIVCDGWSFGVVSRELMALYGAFAAGQTQAALPPADSFGDYVLACQGDEPARAAEADERYWVQMFDGSVPVLDLPSDRPRPGVRGFASRREDLHLAPALVDAARKLGAQRGASLFATLFGLFAGLMGRLAGESDVVVGVPSAGQAAVGMDALVGHCVNLLPVRVSLDPTQSVDALLQHARGRVLDAYEHQACTFGRLLSKLQLTRDASRLPLVSVQFNLDTAISSEELSVAGLTVSLASNPRAYENFDLFINASQVAGGIVLECQYNTELFDAATVRRWLRLYQAAIERSAADPQQPLGRVYAASAEDRARVDGFNATAADYPRDARIEHLVGAQAARTPDSPAVVAGEDAPLSYRELDERANGLALSLLAHGVGPGHLVGLACARNRHLLVGMLGILKAGAGYVPLDPAFPAERLAHMRDDAGLALIVADTATASGLAIGQARLLLADTIAPAASGPAPSTDTGAPAYVIYTSGSTGKPKGVVVPQGAVVNFLASMARTPGLSAQDKLVAVTTPSFDIAVLELLLPLTLGAQVVLASRDTVMDGPALRALIERHGANVMQATPSGWRLLLDAGWNGSPGFKALVGGEALPTDLAQQLLERAGAVWNMYGPTETTVWSTCWQVQAQRAISIGTPIANTTVQVLDEWLEPCPIGVPGEIFIGGAGVTQGYWRRPELTAEKFLSDPAQPGQRLYRTGDRGRWRDDGLLEHLGRLDFQVKVRGYRIELGEIEAQLLRHPDVERSVVVAREDDPGDVRLVAYLLWRGAAPADSGAVREFLRLTLPEYMVPAHVMALPSIPLLPNGKINRKALPKPDASAIDKAERVAPATPLQAQVLQAMEQVLNLPGLGVRDDFFAHGGHSLLAAKLTARLNKEFGVSLPLRTVFVAPTVEGLASAVDEARGGGTPRREPIVHQANAVEAPLTVMQERIRFMEQMHPGRVTYNTPSAHRLSGPFDRDAFERALRTLIQRQPSLRTVVVDDANGPVQRVLDQIAFDLPLQDLSGLPATEREVELMRHMQAIIDQPIAIDRAPLFRVALYRLAPQEHVFLFMPHHIIWDGWSFDLLYREMSDLLPAALEGRPATLPPLPVSYIDYAHWHARWMQGEECRAQIAHWKRRFAGIEAPRVMPTDHARRPGMTGVGAVEWVHVDRALTERLRQVGLDHGVTLNMLVMTVYAAMLSEAMGSRSLVLGVPVRGRLSSEVESVMGFFNNLLPVHLMLQPSLTLAGCLSAVKRELLDAFANEDVPFERLASEPELAKHAHKAGLYQSLFSFQDARERERRWGPLSHAAVLVMQKGATEDLGLWFLEVPSGLEGGINYNADLFDAATAKLFRRRLVGLLQRVADKPGHTMQALLEQPGDDTTAFWEWASSRRAAAVSAPAALPPVARGRSLDPVQQRLAEQWARLLGVDPEQVLPQDNFFDLGGTSLLVMRAVADAERELGLKIDPRRFVFESLQQLSAGATEQVPASAEIAEASGAPTLKPGMLSRVLGRFGRGR